MRIQLSDHFTYRKLLRFTLPSVVMMVFTSIYGVVDGLFVSNFVGKGPFTAVNLVMPVVMIFGGLGFMFGTGGSALVAKTLGQGRRDQANRYFTMIAIATVGTGIVISALGAAFMRPICRWLRADAEIIDDCVLYGRILMGFNTAYMLQNVFQSFLITAEKPKLGLLATIAAGVTNMVLDALFIAGFGWGVAGAAVATGLSQCVGGLFPLLYFLRPNNSLLRLRPVKLQLRPILQSCGNGASEVVSSVTSSIIGMVYNFQLLRFAGKDGVAAYGVLMYTEFIFVAVFIGYAIGSAPVIGYHYGAENTGELKSLLRKSVTLNLGSGIVMLGIAQALAMTLAHLFVGYDPALFSMTVHGFRIFTVAFVLLGLNIFFSSFFTALNNGVVSAAISFLRTFVFKLSAVLVLPLLFKLDGIWWATVVAEVFAFLASGVFLLKNRRKYGYF